MSSSKPYLELFGIDGIDGIVEPFRLSTERRSVNSYRIISTSQGQIGENAVFKKSGRDQSRSHSALYTQTTYPSKAVLMGAKVSVR